MSTQNFHQLSEKIVEDFLQTVVVVDDQAFFPSALSVLPISQLRARLGTIRLFFAAFFDADSASFVRCLDGDCSPSAGLN